MIKRYVVIAAILISMAFAGSAGNTTENIVASGKCKTLDGLIALAKKQILQDEGKQYWWRVFGELDKISDEKFRPCVSKKTDPAATYRYVLEIGSSGAIEKVHWEKSDDFTKCIESVLTGMNLPAPSESPFYFYLSEI